jgi:hypothetical protein
MLNRLAIVTPPRCFAALWGSRRWQNGRRYAIASLAVPCGGGRAKSTMEAQRIERNRKTVSLAA